MQFEPIGHFECAARYPYDAARQAECAVSEAGGVVVLAGGRNFEQAVRDLEGFSRLWLVYVFHHNPHWRPLVRPPRADRKIGVFATRAPYRPNPIGISCVPLIRVDGLRVEVGPNDLLDGTPILDIKPYLPYADSFPDAACGWVDALRAELWEVGFTPEAAAQLDWIASAGGGPVSAFLTQQLREAPCDRARKRVTRRADGLWEIAYRTWRAEFSVDEAGRSVRVTRLRSGYGAADRADASDPHGDKPLHRAFVARFGEH
jgi:tRNA-Thr(GGU) m(6)t(6)A37 methyltransferase TsaA